MYWVIFRDIESYSSYEKIVVWFCFVENGWSFLDIISFRFGRILLDGICLMKVYVNDYIVFGCLRGVMLDILIG